ncbi:psbQ-like 2 [Wolffia australiana]
MGGFAMQLLLCQACSGQPSDHRLQSPGGSSTCPPSCEVPTRTSRRWALAASFLATVALPPLANAETWGARSYVREKYFQPALSPEESAARIRQTAQGLREMRPMLETMSWRYVLFYVRSKMAYLSADLKNAMEGLPESRRQPFVATANELVDNMTELDRFVRTPKVYESYVYYEKTLKSLDDIVAQLA